MAGELRIDLGVTGLTIYALLHDASSQRYNTVSTLFEAHVDGNWTSYDIALTEQGSSGTYAGTMPSVSAGMYGVSVRKQIGGSPALADPHMGGEDVHWDGSAVFPLSDIPTTAEIADGVWDEDIEAAHGTDATSGLLLRVLGQNISNRTHNANLYDSIREVITTVEHQRGAHTHQPIGNIFYVDPVNGDTHANGNRGGISDPYAGIQDCHDNAITDSNHDMIILLSGAAGGVTTLTEDVTLSKRYLFIRGPGRDFVWTRSGAGDTIAITADGVELSGFQLNTAATGTGNGITVTSADFFKAKGLWINDTRGDAIEMTDCDNYVIEDCFLQGSGASGSGHGISIIAGAGQTSDYGLIRGCHINDVQGDGVQLDTTGGGAVDAPLIHGNSFQGCTDDGVDIVDSGVTDAVIHNNWFGNNSGNDIEDAGTNTILLNNEQWAKAGAVADDLDDLPTNASMADAVWDEAVAGHVGAGSFGATDAAILADTNELQGDWVDGGRLDNILDARSSHSAIDVRSEIDANSTKLETIRADTDELQTDWTDGGRLDAIVDAILADTGTDGVVIASGAITAAVIASDAIDDDAIAADVDTYQAKVWLIDDNSGSTDRYFTVWFKNGQPVTSGITSPTIQVIKSADAADLVASTAMTQVGSLGLYRYDEATAANRISAGRAYFVKVEATIDSSTRTWFQTLGRDS